LRERTTKRVPHEPQATITWYVRPSRRKAASPASAGGSLPHERQRRDVGFPSRSTHSRYTVRAGDACVTRRKPTGVKGLFLSPAAALAIVFGFAGPVSAGGASASTLGLVHPGADIVIKSIVIRTPADAIAGTNDVYYVVRFTFTNHLGNTLAPRIDHFAIEDDQKRRFLGADSGSSTLVGISNYPGQLKVGDSHEYTVGFRVPLSTQGTLFYDPTF
jgi:hypothetical protein